MTYNGIYVVCQNLSRPIVPRILGISLLLLVIWQLATSISSQVKLSHYLSSFSNEHHEAKLTKKHQNLALTMYLFGQYLPNDANGIKQSMLNVKLVGTLVAAQDNDSQVIIHASSGVDNMFHVGDALPGGAIIKRIMRDSILVERGGVLESISLPKNELIFEAPSIPLVEDNVHAF